MRQQDTRRPLRRLTGTIEWIFGKLGWLPFVAYILLTVAGAVLLGTIGDLHDGPAVIRMIIGIACMTAGLLIVAAIDWWRRATDRAGRFEAAQANVTLTSAIEPIAQRLALMTRQPSEKKKQERERVVAHACSSMLLVLRDVKNLRATVYRINDDGKTLESVDSHGRKDRPRKFVKGDGGAGDDVFDLIANRGSELIVDTAADERTKDEKLSKHYRTFIRAPIRANERAYGMMTVDAPNAGDLSEADREVVEVLAVLLATANGMVER